MKRGFDWSKQRLKKILELPAHLTVLSMKLENTENIALRALRKIDETKLLMAKSLIHQITSHGIYQNIQDTEFKVFSQFGDDGIIQYLINHIDIDQKKFIEFGVENYTESMTRFLLINNNWEGLVIDNNKENIAYIKQDEIYWKHDLTAIHAFVEKDNINGIFTTHNFSGEIGILSIDIDGNDYWIWECIHSVEPIIVIVEYNSVFGCKHAITIPYDPVFNRTKSHYSNLYWGCSLKALYLLAENKNYAFIGTNSTGNNAYFVRKDKIGTIPPQSILTGYTSSKYRESRTLDGQLSYVSGDDRIKLIEAMPVYDIEKKRLAKIKEL